MKKNLSVAVAAALASGMFAGGVEAVTVSGVTVEYTFDDTLLGLFGSWSISGDKLLFDPTQFKAVASNPGFVNTSQTTPLISVKAKTGFTLQNARLLEQGDYYRLGDAAATGVGVGGQFIVNGSPISFPISSLTDTTSISAFTTTPWTVDLTGTLGGDNGTLKLQNILVAGVLLQNVVAQSFIEKKLVDIWVTTSAVPLPPAAWMLGSALVGLVSVSRRKHAS